MLAGDGVSLDEALEGLMITSTLVRGRDPEYDELVALSTAWSEATLGYLHRLSCDDPLTGLATQPHVRSRLSDLYRARERSPERPLDTHALVVVEIRPGDEGLEQRMTLAQVGRTSRTVFAGSETIGAIGLRRVVVIAERDEQPAAAGDAAAHDDRARAGPGLDRGPARLRRGRGRTARRARSR